MAELIIAVACVVLVILLICGAWCEAERKAPRFVMFTKHVAMVCVGMIFGGVVYCIAEVIATIFGG